MLPFVSINEKARNIVLVATIVWVIPYSHIYTAIIKKKAIKGLKQLTTDWSGELIFDEETVIYIAKKPKASSGGDDLWVGIVIS